MLITVAVVISALAILAYFVQKDIRNGEVSNPFAS